MARWRNRPPLSPFTTALSCGSWTKRTSGSRSALTLVESAGCAATRSLWLGADFDCDTHNHCRARFRHRETARSPSKETLYANRSVAHSRGANRAVLPEPTDEANHCGYEFCQRGALEHSGRSCRTDGSGVTLRTCWSANPQVGFREMLVDCIRSHSPFPLNEHRRKAPTWGPPRIPECM